MEERLDKEEGLSQLEAKDPKALDSIESWCVLRSVGRNTILIMIKKLNIFSVGIGNVGL